VLVTTLHFGPNATPPGTAWPPGEAPGDAGPWEFGPPHFPPRPPSRARVWQGQLESKSGRERAHIGKVIVIRVIAEVRPDLRFN
jgi:hypothetical protein